MYIFIQSFKQYTLLPFLRTCCYSFSLYIYLPKLRALKRVGIQLTFDKDLVSFEHSKRPSWGNGPLYLFDMFIFEQISDVLLSTFFMQAITYSMNIRACCENKKKR